MTDHRSHSSKAGLLVILMALGIPATPASSQDLLFPIAATRRATTPQGTVELIAASPAAAGAKGPQARPEARPAELWLALRFELNPGWHIYWRNPGDSGGPPLVEWHLPPGAKAGDFEWPVPSRIPLESLVNYGYENRVVLPLKITLPPAIVSGPPIRIDADLKWLVCKDVCVSGKASVGLELPLGKEDRPFAADWTADVAAARAAAPRPAPRTWTASAEQNEHGFVLTVRMDRAATPAVFFPLEGRQIEDAAAQEATVNGQELRIRLRKSPRLAKSPAILRGVLAFSSGAAGKGSGVTIEAPVVSARSRPPASRE
jgi:thiol:disulfide interchange protein DsbD